jgi:hypothetical protein
MCLAHVPVESGILREREATKSSGHRLFYNVRNKLCVWEEHELKGPTWEACPAGTETLARSQACPLIVHLTFAQTRGPDHQPRSRHAKVP